MRKYAVMCGSRSGSSYLCDLLKSTNRCGNPNEYFNPELKDSWMEKFGYKPSYVDRLINKTKTENDVFGVKIVGVKDQLETYNNSILNLSHWIWLRRENQILQAISRYRAWETGIWHMKHPNHKKTVEYNKGGIQWCLDEIRSEEKFYEEYFNDKDHIEIWYEDDLVDAPEQTVVSILSYLKISTEEIPVLKTTQIISRDKISEEWQNRFTSDLTN